MAHSVKSNACLHRASCTPEYPTADTTHLGALCRRPATRTSGKRHSGRTSQRLTVPIRESARPSGLRKKPVRGLPLTGLSRTTALQLLRWRRRRLGLRLVLLRSRRVTRLRLHLGFVNRRSFHCLSRAQGSIGQIEEVSRLTLGPALARLDTAGVRLGRAIRSQVVLHVDRALCTELLNVDRLLLDPCSQRFPTCRLGICCRRRASLSSVSLQSLSTRHGFLGFFSKVHSPQSSMLTHLISSTTPTESGAGSGQTMRIGRRDRHSDGRTRQTRRVEGRRSAAAARSCQPTPCRHSCVIVGAVWAGRDSP